MLTRLVTRSLGVARGDFVRIAGWTALNLLLGLVFTALLLFDDHLAHAVGF
jgi:hypothetical protein